MRRRGKRKDHLKWKTVSAGRQRKKTKTNVLQNCGGGRSGPAQEEAEPVR